MSEPVASNPAPSDLPRLRIHHLLVLTTIFSIVMTMHLVFWRFLRSSQPDTVMPEIDAGISFLIIAQFLSISVCVATALFGLAWRRRGIAFPSQPGHWVAVYWTLDWAFEMVLLLAMFLPTQGIVHDSIHLAMRPMSIAFHSLVAYLFVVAYCREPAGIWKWGWAAMALKSMFSAARLLFFVVLSCIEWVIEVVWYVDWQLFRSIGFSPPSFSTLMFWVSLYASPLFFSAAIVTDLRQDRQRHWSHWLVLISTFVSTAILVVYYLLAL